MDNFFEYFPVSTRTKGWGLYATAYGQGKIVPGGTYPPAPHPRDHHFVWKQGRVLREYQLIFISGGRGRFESPASGLHPVIPGTALLLFPGVWHRYEPLPRIGWTEWWIELDGGTLRNLQKKGIIHPNQPLRHTRDPDTVLDLWREAGKLARAKPPGFSVRLGLLALQILTLLEWPPPPTARPGRIARLVSESQSLLAQPPSAGLPPEAIARKLGIGYSYFRRMFKRQTGFSPVQYRLEIRRRRTRDLLRGTTLTLKEIAEQLGYSSPYHLSATFKKDSGASPRLWRRQDMGARHSS